MKDSLLSGVETREDHRNALDSFGSHFAVEYKRLLAYACKLTQNSHDAADLTQATLLRCWAGRKSFELGSSFPAWARAVMRNVYIDEIRRSRFKVDMCDDELNRLLVVSAGQEWIVHLRDVALITDELPPRIREAVFAAAEGVSMKEGAESLRISVAAFKSRLHRGREYLMRRQRGADAMS